MKLGRWFLHSTTKQCHATIPSATSPVAADPSSKCPRRRENGLSPATSKTRKSSCSRSAIHDQGRWDRPSRRRRCVTLMAALDTPRSWFTCFQEHPSDRQPAGLSENPCNSKMSYLASTAANLLTTVFLQSMLCHAMLVGQSQGGAADPNRWQSSCLLTTMTFRMPTGYRLFVNLTSGNNSGENLRSYAQR